MAKELAKRAGVKRNDVSVSSLERTKDEVSRPTGKPAAKFGVGASQRCWRKCRCVVTDSRLADSCSIGRRKLPSLDSCFPTRSVVKGRGTSHKVQRNGKGPFDTPSRMTRQVAPRKEYGRFFSFKGTVGMYKISKRSSTVAKPT